MKRTGLKHLFIVIFYFSPFVLLLFGPTVLINVQTDGLTYSDVAEIPFRKTGLVLGCPKKLPGGRENPFFTERINAAVGLFRAGKVESFLVSGDNISKGCFETISMKDELIRKGVPAGNIFCDYKGLRTLDSVVRAKETFGRTEMTIISQEFQNKRAIFIARHDGINAIAFNAGDVHTFDGYLIRGRELLAKFLAILDIYIFGTKPEFYDSAIPVDSKGRFVDSCSGGL